MKGKTIFNWISLICTSIIFTVSTILFVKFGLNNSYIMTTFMYVLAIIILVVLIFFSRQSDFDLKLFIVFDCIILLLIGFELVFGFVFRDLTSTYFASLNSAVFTMIVGFQKFKTEK